MHMAGSPRDTVSIWSGLRGWTRAEVRAEVGRPDEVDSHGNWCYGTNGAESMATLGTVVFERGRVSHVYGAEEEPPPVSVISEAGLVAGMRALFRNKQGDDRAADEDPLRLIRAANLLIAMGQTKAIAVLDEYARISSGQFDDVWLYYLVRAAFTSKLAGGEFFLPWGGMINPIPEAQLRKWPTYPTVVIDDVPFCFTRSEIMNGFASRFEWYLLDHQNEWLLRKEPLVPPGDPFLCYRKLVSSQVWAVIAEYSQGGFSPQSTRDIERRTIAQILSLVRDVLRAPQEPSGITASDFERVHKRFLSLGCRWEANRQSYSR